MIKIYVYNNATEDEIDEYLTGYKNRDNEYTIKLIKAFQPMFDKYTALLKDGIYDIHDRKIRAFLRLYAGDARRKVNNYIYSEKLRDTFAQVADWFRKMFSVFDKEEIYHECVTAFLHMANMYKNTTDRPGFHLFVSRYYHIYLNKQFTRIMKEPLVRFIPVEYRDGLVYQRIMDPADDNMLIERANNYLLVLNTTKVTVPNNNDYNLNWINGITATGIFKKLDVIGRKILVEYYIHKKKESTIAYELGFKAQSSAHRRKRKLLERIDKHGKDYNLLCMHGNNSLRKKRTKKMFQVQRTITNEYESDIEWPDKAGVYDSELAR